MAIVVYLRYFRTLEILPLDRPFLKNPTTELNILSLSCIETELCQFEFFDKMAAGRLVGFGPTGSNAIRSADPENPTLEPNMNWIG